MILLHPDNFALIIFQYFEKLSKKVLSQYKNFYFIKYFQGFSNSCFIKLLLHSIYIINTSLLEFLNHRE